jgi:hypothetical protein
VLNAVSHASRWPNVKFTDSTPVNAVTVLLHPAYRKGYFDTHSAYPRQYIEPTIRAAHKLWQKHFKPRVEGSVQTSQSSEIGQIENPSQHLKAKAAGAIHDQLQDEFDNFNGMYLRPIYILNPGNASHSWRTISL